MRLMTWIAWLITLLLRFFVISGLKIAIDQFSPGLLDSYISTLVAVLPQWVGNNVQMITVVSLYLISEFAGRIIEELVNHIKQLVVVIVVGLLTLFGSFILIPQVITGLIVSYLPQLDEYILPISPEIVSVQSLHIEQIKQTLLSGSQLYMVVLIVTTGIVFLGQLIIKKRILKKKHQ